MSRLCYKSLQIISYLIHQISRKYPWKDIGLQRWKSQMKTSMLRNIYKNSEQWKFRCFVLKDAGVDYQCDN